MKDTFFRDEINDLKKKGLYRELRTVEGEQDSSVLINGKRVLMFSSNNYLGLANHPGIKKHLWMRHCITVREAGDRDSYQGAWRSIEP